MGKVGGSVFCFAKRADAVLSITARTGSRS